ncbi:AAA family ATPase [Ruminococcus sp.]|uniref:AAA family ATPase n=1 Tax=Ruminococcus sp. TaxID=41978 RepID=UPI00258AD23B|nr:AAA family ATPase [Ruminococcus sp.]MCR5020310.1 AAA family ATPase [Ruminococcus sp.]
MNKIRICRVQVKNLFGYINYDIDLGENKPIAIITAPNGRGKTTILNLVSFMFNPMYDAFSYIKTIPFEEFRCILSNGKSVELKRIQNNTEGIKPSRRQVPMIREQATRRAFSFFENDDYAFEIYDDIVTASNPIIYSNAYKETFEIDPSEYMEENDIPYLRGQITNVDRLNYIWKKQLDLLKILECSITVNFIKADRIQPVMVMPKRSSHFDEPYQESPLKMASNSISEYIKNSIERYNEAVSKAKDKLPQMFLDGEGSNLNSDEFMDGWSVYRQELNQFQEIGLITPTEDFTMRKDISSVYKEKGAFLSTYLSAFKDTTTSLQDVYNRLNLFKQILDERNAITGKEVKFGRNGIILFSGNKELDLESLSSGEKHDFIMFYNLIFNSKENGLVLIDEPEISLHIEWQETYLDKLIAICKMNGLQAIVATHSPNIVSSHYDFLVDKGETDG